MGSADARLVTELAGIELRAPVVLAAGTAGYGTELGDAADLGAGGGIGAIVGKSITALARDGNDTWRIIEHKAGMLNAIGLANVGLEGFLREVAPGLEAAAARGGMPRFIGSVSGFSVDDYVRVAAAMDGVACLAAVEVNVSCPNVAHGCEFGSDERLLAELIAAVRGVLTKKRLLVKLAPTAVGRQGEGVVGLCRAAIEAGGKSGGPAGRAGADVMVIANTMPALAIDVETRRPRLARGSGGLSGPAIHPIVVKLVYEAYRGICKDAGVPIVGLGGVMTWDDAAEFILAGATAVGMGTALFVDPRAAAKVSAGLAKWVTRQGAANVRELVGAARM